MRRLSGANYGKPLDSSQECPTTSYIYSFSFQGMFTDKKLAVDTQLLRYLHKEVGVRFESLRVCATHVMSVDGKELGATDIAVNAEIEGEVLRS